METQFTKKTYAKSQVSLLTKSMLIAGIAFLIIGLVSYGFSVLFQNTLDNANRVAIGLPICLVMLIGGMIISIMWMANMAKNGSVALTILCYLLYIVMTSTAFGWIFSVGAETAQAYWLPVMFAVVGFIFLLATLIAQVVSVRGIITMGKIIAISAIVMSIMFLVFFIMMLFMIFLNPTGAILTGDALCSLTMAIMSIISFLYIIIDVWQISKMSEFAQNVGQEYPKIMPWFFGYKLLTDLVNVLFIVIYYFIRFSRRG